MNALRKKRKFLGYTQFALAKDAGISYGRLTFAETGRIKLTPAELEKIRDAINRRVAQITARVAA